MLASHLDWFFSRTNSFKDRTAIIEADKTFSYDQVICQVDAIRSVLSDEFAYPPCLLTCLEDGVDTAIFLNAACHSGCVVPVNPSITSFELQRLQDEVKGDAIVVQDVDDALLNWAKQNNLGVLLMESDLKLEWLRKPVQREREPDDICLILQTSGSTGKTKFVPITAQALASSCETIATTLQLSPDDQVVHMLPMFHIGAVLDLFLVPLWAGGSVRLAHPAFTENLAAALQVPDVTWCQAVPTMLNALVDHLRNCPDANLSPRLRFVRSVSADLAPDIHVALEDQLGGIPVVQMYGMTETAGQIASNLPSLSDRKLGSVGRFKPDAVMIMDRFANPLAHGKIGEICVTGDNVTTGYLNSDNAENFIGAWLKTGDLGYIDPDGYLHLAGRVKEMINKGGEKISPLEIEQCLYGLPQVSEAAVFPIAHATLQEDVGCALSFKQGQDLPVDAVLDHLRERLSSYKIPRKIHVLPRLPKLGSGKINKGELRRLCVDAQSASINGQAASLTEKKLAKVWTSVLKTPTLSPEDDFFEQGGDSLVAQTFILDVEKAFDLHLPANVLYDAPRFMDLVTFLENKTLSAAQTALPHEVYQAVRTMTASWPGARKHENSLIVSQNTSGAKAPFFFIAADQINYTDLAKAFGVERPFHAMRTLSRQKCETDENMQRLAEYYANEILSLNPDQPIFLGGLCKGAHVAQMVADELIKLERVPDLLVVIDYQMTRSYPGRGVCAWSKTTEHSAVSNFLNPENGLTYLFPNGADALRIDAEHGLCTHGAAAQQLVEFLEPLMKPSAFHDVGNQLLNRKKAYRSNISIRAPRFVSPGQKFDAQLIVKNMSPEVWHPTPESNLRVLAKWRRPNGKIIDEVIASCDLDQAVAPGNTVTLSLPVTYPDRRSSLQLYVDMVDDGVAWFGNPSRHQFIRRFW